MNADELAAIPKRHHEAVFRDGTVRHWTGRCVSDDQPWPCDTMRLFAHIAAVTAAVEHMTFRVPRECGCHEGQMRNAQEPEEYRAAVLAILRGDA